METDKSRALTNFYREEFLKHLQCLDEIGLVPREKRETMDRLWWRIVHDLDRVCCCEEFPAKAEALLRSFDALTRLSQTSDIRGH